MQESIKRALNVSDFVADCIVHNEIEFSDKEIMEWLCNLNYISIERLSDNYVNSPTYGLLPYWAVFTVPSQRVIGNSVRNALSAAMVAGGYKKEKDDEQ